MKHSLLFSFFIIAAAICSGADFVAAVRNDLPSPDGKKRIVVFYRLLATKPLLTLHGAVLFKGEEIPDGDGNAFVFDTTEAKEGDADYIKVTWKENGDILVIFGRRNRVLKKEISVRGVSIEYRELSDKANQSSEPTLSSVTPPAGQESRPR
jgi:hypothetical protein